MSELQKSGVVWVTVGEEKAGQRIDNFLINYLKGIPRTRIYRLVRSGDLRINKKRVAVSYRLQLNDQIRIPPLWLVERANVPVVSENLSNVLSRRILYEDNNLIVLNKPAGIAVHGGSGIRLGVIEALRQKYPKLTLELVHRLDRDTSGCLLIAKKSAALRTLHTAMRAHEIIKNYQLLVQGHWPKRLQHIDQPLCKNQLMSGERMVFVSDTGKPARTHFQLEACYKDASLVTARLETGRTHQIRVHAAYAKHPIAGDDKYGDKDFNHQMRLLGLRRLFLHASEICLRLPGQTDLISFKAPLDADLQHMLECLQ